MLAYPVENGRLERLGSEFLLQPKINGERARLEWFHDIPVLLSSYGNEFKFLYHIKEELKILHDAVGPIPLDGEIYVHGWSRERIDSALRTKNTLRPDNEFLEYHVFDIAII